MQPNKHLEHPEDLLFKQGLQGAKNVVQYFTSIVTWLQGKNDNIKTTIKYDGSPAVCFGIHPSNGEFFVSTKSLFNKTSLFAFNKKQIKKLFNPGIHDTLGLVLDTFEQHMYPTGIWQGDILYTPQTLKETETHYLFRHNTLVYKVDKTSSMGKEISQAKLGLVVHTEYRYENEEYHANFAKKFIDMGNVIWQPPLKVKPSLLPKDAIHITYIKGLIETLEKDYKRLFDMHKKIEHTFSDPKTWFLKGIVVINKHIREWKNTPTAAELWKSWEMEMWTHYKNKPSFDFSDIHNPCLKISQFENQYKDKIIAWLQWYLDVVECKKYIIQLLNSMTITPGLELLIADSPSKHEGFVVHHTKDQWVIKLVERSIFSKANFTLPKSWDKNPIK